MPYITSAKVPAAEVEYYQVDLDGNISQVDPMIDGDQAFLKMDVTNVSLGQHTVAISACNLWGCSAFADPFVFTKVLPGVPSGIGLVA